MSDQQAPPRPAESGFSSRWILDGRTKRATRPVAGDANASARAIDTDGDGVADTLALRVDAERTSLPARIGAWLGRSIAVVVFVAALVATAAASAAYVQASDELDRTAALLETERADARQAREAADRAQARVAELEGAAVKTERDELRLEVEALRRMLLDQQRSERTAR